MRSEDETFVHRTHLKIIHISQIINFFKNIIYMRLSKTIFEQTHTIFRNINICDNCGAPDHRTAYLEINIYIIHKNY